MVGIFSTVDWVIPQEFQGIRTDVTVAECFCRFLLVMPFFIGYA